ncbi:MAG: DUF72 domain-containing protein [Deltaproteobacteria bacterium]|nr:DUF72 domain-containing protein [Deltaproteobacteria bacterium]
MAGPMNQDTDTQGIHNFYFRDIHPKVFLGTASDRYAGWIGQIYTPGRYRPNARSKVVGGKSFKEEVLPVECVREYFTHFSVLEIDYTFYSTLLDKNLEPTQSYRVLQTYRRFLTKHDHLVLKVPQVVFARRLRAGGKFIDNPDYLNPDIFTRQFYDPATKILGDLISGFVFEQEYQPKKDRTPPKEYVDGLDKFFSELPGDTRYHVETRTESYYASPYFDLLQKHGIGHVFSHWTWLPPLRKQFLRCGKRFLNSGRQCIIRLMTPRGMRYEEAYAKAFPFDRLVDGMISPGMIPDTVDIVREAVRDGIQTNVIINNRAGGNAPLIAKEIARKLADNHGISKMPDQETGLSAR